MCLGALPMTHSVEGWEGGKRPLVGHLVPCQIWVRGRFGGFGGFGGFGCFGGFGGDPEVVFSIKFFCWFLRRRGLRMLGRAYPV